LLRAGLSPARSCRRAGLALAARLSSEERRLLLRPCLGCGAPVEVAGSEQVWIGEEELSSRQGPTQGRQGRSSSETPAVSGSCLLTVRFSLSPPTLTDQWLVFPAGGVPPRHG